MNIKQVAEMFDMSIDTIRYYERIGVVPPIKRDQKGYRIFSKRDLNWIFLSKSLRNAGLSIENLIEFASLSQTEGDVRLAQKDILKEQLFEINEKMEQLERVKNLLEYKIETYDDHLAKFNLGDLSDDKVEELWKNSKFAKHEHNKDK